MKLCRCRLKNHQRKLCCYRLRNWQWQWSHFWIYFFFCCVITTFANHLHCWRWSNDNVVDDIIFHKLNLSLSYQLTKLDILKFLWFPVEWPKIPSWYSHFSFGLYHIGNNGCMGSDGLRVIHLMFKRYWWYLNGKCLSVFWQRCKSS